MAFTSGTATDYIDLANKLRQWLTASAGWTQLAWTPGNVTTGGMRLSMRAPGAATDKQVFFNMQSFFSDADQAYAWDIRCAVNYDASRGFGVQDGESSPTYFALWKSTISYWFYANDRRVIVIAKCNTAYMSMYAGFGLPWATPAEYPFPLYVAASDGILRPYNSNNSAHTSIVDPGGASSESGGDYCSAKVRAQDGTWYRVMNRQSGTATEYPYNFKSTQPFVYPYTLRGAFGGSFAWWQSCTEHGANTDSGAIGFLVPTAQAERIMLPTSVMRTLAPAGIMALDGVYMPLGNGLTPEQTATLGARNFRMFNNITRINANSFFAIEEN